MKNPTDARCPQTSRFVIVAFMLMTAACSTADPAAASAAAALQRAGLTPAQGASVDVSTGFPTEVVHEKTGAVLVLIPAGEFTMGSPANEVEEFARVNEAQHRRVIQKPFYLGKTELTQAQWLAVMRGTDKADPSQQKGDDLPVHGVSWHGCQEFLVRAGGDLRLPSEAEWEYACRANTTTAYWFGDEPAGGEGTGNYCGPKKLLEMAGATSDRVWPFDDSHLDLAPVGTYRPNPWGLHDMHGNVLEWCEDGFASYPAFGTEVPAPAAHERVLRGGDFATLAPFCRSAARYKQEPWVPTGGLRLARSLP